MWRQLFFALLLTIMMESACARRKTILKNIEDKVTSIEVDVKDIKQKILRLDDIFNQLSAIGAAVNALPSTIQSNMALPVKKIRESIDENCKAPKQQAPRCSDRRLITDNEGYLLAFRLTGGIKKSAYDKYVAVGLYDDSNDLVFYSMPCGCKTTNSSLYCDRHYRSVLLDLMPLLPVEKVRVAVYKKGVEKVRIVFDGRKRNHLNFFQQKQILEDPYTDLSSTTPADPNSFSIAGDDLKRRFFINNNYHGCTNDAGWLVVGDGPGSTSCPWEQKHEAHYPFILYANTPSNQTTPTEKYMKTTWQTQDPGEGDVLTISIKLRSSDC
uniref:Capsule gland specific secretory protein n=1 Tax=Reishia bronni TaxID=578817 RepID=A0A6G9KQR6_9CAEN|nr:capsule gland specific secretory protein [Reishia bronni]